RAGLLRLGEEDHTLLLTLHHIISDGWSTGVLIREMVLLYEAFLEEKPSPLAELPIQYADFASWQRQWLQGEVLDEQLSYWKQQLGEAPPVLELPTDRPRLALQTYKGATHHFTLPKQVAEKLKALSQQKGATLFMTLLAAFKTLLYRYSGQEDVVVGTPIANRNHVEIEGLIGFFVNTLVLRADLSGNPTFLELLDQVKEAALGAYAHQDLPFEKLVEEIQPERAPGMFPLYQVMFALQNAPKEKMALPGLTLEWSANVSETANYDFGLFMSEKDQAIAGGFHYNTDLFDEATMARMAEHFEVLLQEIVKDPARRVSDFEILTDPERNLLSVEWDHAEATAVRRCIHELFEEQAARQPDGAALSFEGEQTSYARLNARGNRMAHALRSLRPAEARTIAILLNPGMDQIASMLGVLKAGHTFVCLDSKYPVARLKQIMSDAEPSCLITESEYLSDPQGLLRQLVGEGDCEILAVDVAGGPTGEPGFDGRLYDSSYLETFPTTNLDVAVRPDGPAYLVYTSGSTGRPKAIVQSHGSFCQFIKWQSEQFAIQAPKRVAQWASISYDASYCEVFGALCFGATLCLATNSVRHDPAALVRWMRREEISLLQVVPSFCRQILQVLDAEDRSDHSNPFPHLEVVLLAGEVLNVDIAINWLERLGSHPRLFNLYGPTESVLATYYHVNSPEAIRYGVPVGRAIDGRQILVLDKRQNLCPIGVKGEIYIRSPFLTLGYLNRPEETQKAFLQNPLNGQYADPVYRTGDLGRWLPDGNLEFYGRVDNQVKIRGMRVELEDIESTLSTHDSISECAVVAHDYGEGDKRLVAYVVRDPDYNGRDEQISGEALGVLHVDQYQDVYDEIYSLSEAFS
ncbi:MAG TPA: amino acid adenylation domain-containing protein, partial [Blastocatellia bacterium]